MKNKMKYLNQLIQSKAPAYGGLPCYIQKSLNKFWLNYLIETIQTAPLYHYIIIDINTQTHKTDYIYTESSLILTNPSSYFAIQITNK